MNEYDARGFNPPERTRHQEFTVVRYSAHPRYKPGRFLNDIAILHLEGTIDLTRTDGVNAACMPPCTGMFDGQFRNGTGVR